MADEVVEDDLVSFTATVSIIPDTSSQQYLSPDGTISAPATIARADTYLSSPRANLSMIRVPQK